jgi:hypothetical protein
LYSRVGKRGMRDMGLGSHRYSRMPHVFVWLWAFALVAQTSAVAPVLCVRADGQVEVEDACRCHPDPSTQSVAVSSASISLPKPENHDDRCSRCFDLRSPIGTGAPGSADQGLSVVVSLLRSEASAVSTAVSTNIAMDIPSEASASRRSPPDKTSLVSLRTIVLLC